MSVEQAYINGFVKRAAEYGYSEDEAVDLWKGANAQNVVAQQDPMWSANPPKQQNFNTAPATQSPSVAPVSSAPTYTASQEDLNILKNTPLTNMTPKDKWVQGLGDIMSKKPVFGFDSPYLNVQQLAPDSTVMASDHFKDLAGASHYRNKPLPRPEKYDFNQSQKYLYNKTLKEHMNKYDTKWGKSFRPPIQNIPDLSEYEKENSFIANINNLDLKESQKSFNDTFAKKFK